MRNEEHEVKCPYCGIKNKHDADFSYEDEYHEEIVTCESPVNEDDKPCGKPFYLKVQAKIHNTVRKIDGFGAKRGKK